MNPMKARIKVRLDSLPDELSALRRLGLQYLDRCCAIDTDDSVQLGHMPWVAPLAYAITLFPPAKRAWVNRFKGKIPRPYQRLLAETNGLFAFGLSLYGLAPSMHARPPRLNRSRLECHDLSLANSDWIKQYDLEGDLFHFGGREYSETETLGYFMTGADMICALRRNGEVVEEWETLSDFLADELAAAKQVMEAETPGEWWQ